MIALLSLIVAAMLQGPALPAAQGNMKTIAKGTDSGVESARQATARTLEEWAALWHTHAPNRDRPPVNFSRDMVVGVFLGSRPTAGFDVEITGTREANGVLVVLYRETAPGPDTITAQILTAPYHLVAIPAFAGDVRFEPTAAKVER